MLTTYISKLMDNLPTEWRERKTPLDIDLILSGGAFNGSYLIGALCFLKEMEKNNYIRICRISGCSIGSIAGLLYLLDDLPRISKIYKYISKQWKKKHNLSALTKIRSLLGDKINTHFSDINGKLFVSYNNIVTKQKIVKSSFLNADDLCDCLVRSCFIPFIIDNNICYQDKYVDGLHPFLLDAYADRKRLFIDVFTYDKWSGIWSIQHEKNAYYRILSGLLDIHLFFCKGKQTIMCSYIENWNFYKRNIYCAKILCEKGIIYFMSFIHFIYGHVISKIPKPNKSFSVKLAYRLYQTIYDILLETYCF